MGDPPKLDTSFEGKERPQSPHNISTPVTAVGEGGFLSVPTNIHRSRQNSVDTNTTAEDAVSVSKTAVPSVGEPANTSSPQPAAVAAAAATSAPGEKRSKKRTDLNNDKVMSDPDALKPDNEADERFFRVENNSFAFSPGQLSKMFNPKSLSAFYALGGLAGLEKGLRSDRKVGLGAEEAGLSGAVSFDEATGKQDTFSPEIKGPAARTQSDVKGKGKGKGRHEPGSGSSAAADVPFADRKRVFGDNRLPEKKGKSLLQIMWITYNDKILILLSIAAVISLAVGIYQSVGVAHKPGEAKIEWVEGVAIVAAILIVVIVGSLNDYQKERQFAKLNRKKQDRVIKVTRSGRPGEVSVYDVLVGDLISLEPGDLIPVDGIFVQGFNVKCDESQATGESDVIRKRPADEVYAAIENHQDLRKMDPFIQSGARVMEGVGTYMATATGVNSTYGKTLMSLNQETDMTPLQSKLNVIAEMIAKLGGAAALLLFIVLFIQFLVRLRYQPPEVGPSEKGQQFLNIFIVVVTIIVVAVPEGLPLAVTLALAFATTRMIKDNNLVRLLKACEVMGNATTICSDKTGTLTQNKMTVVAGSVGTANRFGGARPASFVSENADRDGDHRQRRDDHDEDDHDVDDGADITAAQFAESLCPEVRTLLRNSIALNSTAFEGEVDGEKTFIGSKTETALLMFARKHFSMGPVGEERENAKTLQIIPFDSGRKCMGVVVRLPEAEGGGARLYLKGASEIVLDRCDRILAEPSTGTSVVPVTPENRDAIMGLITSYASRSLRTIGIVYRDFEEWPPRRARRVDGDNSEVEFLDLFRDLVFVGVVGIQDPLREGVREAVRLCQHAGVVIRMVTGDNKLTAEAIAHECGIIQPDSVVMEGPEFRRLSSDQQRALAPRLHVLARSSPEDKRILVEQLKSLGETVAVTGDGTNDAPALKTADIGFSMGIAGTEVAKEASDIILMDDNFNSIVSALKWGRTVNDAVKRFLQFQLTVNVTAVLLTFITAVANEEESSVLTAVQLLWVNLIMDTLAALALATDPPTDSVLNRQPERKNAPIITVTMWKMILGQAMYQLAITLMLYWGSLADPDVLPTNEVSTRDQINVLVFNTFVWMQIFNQWNNRRLDNEFNILEGITRNWIFIAVSVIMCGAQVLIIFLGGPVFNIPPEGQSAVHWGVALVLGAISIPVGMIIRLIPDSLVVHLVPSFLRNRHSKTPDLTVSDEEAADWYGTPLGDVRDQLEFLKRVKGGRLNNLKFAVRHPRERFIRRGSRSPSHSRSGSVRTDGGVVPPASSAGGDAAPPVGLERENSFTSPPSETRSRSMRSRSNSALGAPTVMAGLVAAGIAANWQPPNRTASRDDSQRATTSEGQSADPQAQAHSQGQSQMPTADAEVPAPRQNPVGGGDSEKQ